ncbi:hypothetical protein J4Q44_G00394360, partial [Coregonus suidteri]
MSDLVQLSKRFQFKNTCIRGGLGGKGRPIQHSTFIMVIFKAAEAERAREREKEREREGETEKERKQGRERERQKD